MAPRLLYLVPPRYAARDESSAEEPSQKLQEVIKDFFNQVETEITAREEIERRFRKELNAWANAERERLYAALRSGDERLVIVSKVGNFAIDLADANVAIQVSGTFGSRQEEAQRLGRILRPKTDGSGAVFYSVVTLGSRDQEFAEKRQLFLAEQGYTYEIVEAAQLDVIPQSGAAT